MFKRINMVLLITIFAGLYLYTRYHKRKNNKVDSPKINTCEDYNILRELNQEDESPQNEMCVNTQPSAQGEDVTTQPIAQEDVNTQPIAQEDGATTQPNAQEDDGATTQPNAQKEDVNTQPIAQEEGATTQPNAQEEDVNTGTEVHEAEFYQSYRDLEVITKNNIYEQTKENETFQNLSSKTLKELKEIAKQHKISINKKNKKQLLEVLCKSI